jgi:hypothetical protein
MRSVLALVVILVSALGWTQGQSNSRISAQKFKSKAMKSSRLNQPKLAQFTRTETLSQSALSAPQLTQEDGIFSGILNASYSRSFVDQVNGTLQSSQALLLIMNTKLSTNWALTNRISLSQDLRDEESLDDGFSDFLFILARKPILLNHWLLGSPVFMTVLPTAERSTQVQNLQTSLSAGYNFIINPEVLTKGVNLSLNVGVSRNFHEFETDKTGNVLNQYGLRETFSTGYSFGRWAFSADFVFRHAMTYQNNWVQAFEHSQEAAFNVSKNWALTMGHTNSGSWLAPNGQDSNFKLINEDDSIIYVSTSLVF